jgi:hypothetical protein
MVGRYMVVEPEAVEQRTLRDLPTHDAHDPPPLCRSESRLRHCRKQPFLNSLDRFMGM